MRAQHRPRLCVRPPLHLSHDPRDSTRTATATTARLQRRLGISGACVDSSSSRMSAVEPEPEHQRARSGAFCGPTNETSPTVADEVKGTTAASAVDSEKNGGLHASNANGEAESQDDTELEESSGGAPVTDEASLSAESDRLVPLLALSTEWTVRVSSLRRIVSLARDTASNSQPNFPIEMWCLRTVIVDQLTDRRSLVVKQACDTIAAVSTQFKRAYLAPPTPSDADAVEDLAKARKIWLDLTVFFIDALLPKLPITVQVISAASCLCLNLIVKNIAGLFREDLFDYPVLQHLLPIAATHKHNIVRDHCYRLISKVIIRLDQRYVAHEAEQDRGAFEQTEADEPDQESAPADAASPAGTAPAAAATAPSSSLLLSKLEHAIQTGLNDSFDKARAAARLCLIQFQTIAPLRADRILHAMSPSQRKHFLRHKSEYESNKALTVPKSSSSSATGEIDSTSPSDEELEAEVNPKPGAKSPTATTTTITTTAPTTAAAAGSKSATADVGLKSKIAAHKKEKKKEKKKAAAAAAAAAANGSSSNEPTTNFFVPKKTILPKLSPAAAAEKQKELDADKVLKEALANRQAAAAQAAAAAAAAADEADEESSPVSENKPASAAAAAHDDEEDPDADSEEDGDESATPAAAVVATTGAAFASNSTLLSKLLDLESPMLTEKMIDFLMRDGVVDAFIAFISRVTDADINLTQLASVQTFDQLGAKYHNVYTNDLPPGEGVAADGTRPEYSDLPLVHRERPDSSDADEQTAVRRSFQAFQILCGQRQSQALMAVLRTKIPIIVLRLMCVFHPKSRGNFYHACAVLQKLVGLFPGAALTALCSPPGRVLLSLMFDHLHEPPVIPTLLAFIQASVDNKVMGSTVPTDLIHHLDQMDVLGTKLVPRIIACPTPSRLVSQASTDFLLQLLEKVAAVQTERNGASICRIFDGIGEEGREIDQLVRALTEAATVEPARPSWQVGNIGLLLHTLLTASSEESMIVAETDVNAQAMAQMMGNAALLQKRIANPLFPLKVDLQHALVDQIGPICTLLTRPDVKNNMETTNTNTTATATTDTTSDDTPSSATLTSTIQFSSYAVSVAFTSKRLQVLKLLLKLCLNDIDDALDEAAALRHQKAQDPTLELTLTPASILSGARLFNAIPHETWLTFVEWFFRYTHNNFFLGAFKTLLLAIVRLTVAAAKERESLKKTDAAAAAAPAPVDETLKFLLVESRFLVHMISFYTNPNRVASCTAAYILDICNHLRLSTGLLPHSSFLYDYLQSSQQWHTFLPALQAESQKQARNLHTKPFEDQEDPERAALERALGFSLGGGGPPANPNAFVIPPGYGDGIELGSVFAWHLGFVEKGTPGAGGDKAGKKKKKKKKKKKAKKKSEDGTGSQEGTEGEETDSNSRAASDDDSDDDAGSDMDSAASSTNTSPAKKLANLTLSGDSAPSSPVATDAASSSESESPSNGSGMLSPSPPISPMLDTSPKA